MSNFVNRTQGHFTIIENDFLNNPLIYFKEKGLYAFLASKPPGWRFCAKRIATQTKEGRKSVLNSLKALESYGLLTRKKLQNGQAQYILHMPSQKIKDLSTESQKGTLAPCNTGTVQQGNPISNNSSLVIQSNEGENHSLLPERNKYYDLAVDIETYFDKRTINSHDELLSWARFLEKNKMADENTLSLIFENLEDKCPSQKTFKKAYGRFKKNHTSNKTVPVIEGKIEKEEISSEDLERLKEYGIIPKEAEQ